MYEYSIDITFFGQHGNSEASDIVLRQFLRKETQARDFFYSIWMTNKDFKIFLFLSEKNWYV
jgi:hypothetical protein